MGNLTGLGMAPFLMRHPVLLNNWMMAREEALARVRAQEKADATALAGFHTALAEARQNAADWHSAHEVQEAKLADLRDGLTRLMEHIAKSWDTTAAHPWDALWRWGQAHLPLEAQFGIDGTMTVAQLRAILQEHYGWAIHTDYSEPANCARFWYISEERLEPRLGERFEEEGASRELPLDTGRQAAALWQALKDGSEDTPLARLLLAHPEHRLIARRAQIASRHPYAGIRDNLIAGGATGSSWRDGDNGLTSREICIPLRLCEATWKQAYVRRDGA